MTVDELMLSLALALGVLSRPGLAVSIWILINIGLISVIDTFDNDYYWSSMALWAALFSIKDFILILILSAMRAPLILILAIFASCLFHQVLRWQIMTYNYSNLSLLDVRPIFMLLVSVSMLATVVLDQIQGGGSGGKRAKHYIPIVYNRLINIFYRTSHKVER